MQNQIKKKDAQISNLKTRLDAIGSDNDKLKKQLEDAIDKTTHQKLKNKVAKLIEKLETSEKQMEYWQQSYESNMESSDALANKNESLIADNV